MLAVVKTNFLSIRNWVESEQIFEWASSTRRCCCTFRHTEI